MSRRNRAEAFTLLELLVAVVILAILASMATAGMTRYRDRAQMMEDETHLKVASAALKLYAYDNNFLPGSLSQLRPEHWQKAYAQRAGPGARSLTLLAFFREWISDGVAEAGNDEDTEGPSWDRSGKYMGTNPWATLTCPADATPPPPPGISYSLDPNMKNAPVGRMTDPAYADARLLYEADSEGGPVVYRHRGGTLSAEITVGGKIRWVGKP